MSKLSPAQLVYEKPLGFRKNKLSGKLEIFDRNERTVATIEATDDNVALSYAKLFSASPNLFKGCHALFQELGLDPKHIAKTGDPSKEICRAATGLEMAEERGLINLGKKEQSIQ